ncbi:class II aldolase/adducin family protein [Marmoricola sp. URHA0025 HA25]
MQHLTSRRHVVDMCRTMLERGYLKATEGNVSVRIPGQRLYAVTPSNYDYDQMRVEDICIVDFDGTHVPDPGGSGLAPSIECGMHANVYRERPDVNAIVHTHQPYASALAYLRKEIPALTDEQVRFLGKRVAIIDYAPAGTGFLAKNVQKKVAGGDNAFIIANHGIVALGTDPDRAVFNMALLEKVSIAYLLALTTESGKVYTIPAAIREIAFTKLRKDEKRIAAQITESVPPVRVAPTEDLPSADATAAQIAQAGTPGPETQVVETPGSEAAPARLRDQPVSRRRGHDAPAQGTGGPARPGAAPRRTARRAGLLRHQVRGQQGDHRPGEDPDPGRRPAQPRVQLPLPAGDREGRGCPPGRPRRQHLHRLPPGRGTHDPRQQLRAGQREGRRDHP